MLLNIIITSFFLFPVCQALINNVCQQSSRNTLTTISVSRLSFLRCDGRTFSAESIAVKGSNSLSAVDYSLNDGVKSPSEKSVQPTSIKGGNEIAYESTLLCADNHRTQSSMSNILKCGTAYLDYGVRALKRKRPGGYRGSIAIVSDRWTVHTTTTRASKWSLCMSVQNRIYDEDEKELNQKGTKEMETVPVNMFHSVLCGNSRTLHSSDPSEKEKDKDKVGAAEEKVPIVLLHGLLGSARNFQSWMKLVQQKESESEIEREEHRVTQEQQDSSPLPTARTRTRTRTRDIICMDLRNHGRTGSHYGTLEMDFEGMARDLLHTLKSLGLTRVHVVGHSLGGKVAAVAALYLAEENRLKEAKRVDVAAGEGSERQIELMSLTLIDVSPVDYAGDDAFAEVFSTLDIVEQLNVQLPLIGAEPSTKESAGCSSSSGGREKEGAADRASPYARNVLSSMLGEKVEDPMLKAFLLASIQPVDRNRAGGGTGEGDRGGLSVSIREIMSKIESSKNFLHLHRPEQAAADSSRDSKRDSDSDSRALHASTEQEQGSPGGFEWKFSVEGISDFRERLGGWPGKYTANQADPSGLGEQKGGEKEEEGCLVTPYVSPVLVMKGALSKFVKSSHISPIAGLFPLYTLLTVRDAGHWLHFEKPKESSEALIKFILKVEDRHREINKP